MPHGDQMDRLQQVLDGFNAHDLDAILSHFAEDCVFESSRGLPVGHGVCADGQNGKVGDSAIFALRAQLYGNRASVAIVSGISSREPHVEALFDSACNALDENYDPIPPKLVVERLEDCVRSRYTATARTTSPVGGARRERATSSPPSTTGSPKASTPPT